MGGGEKLLLINNIEENKEYKDEIIMIDVNCPNCGERLGFEKNYYNNNFKFECPFCNSNFDKEDL